MKTNIKYILGVFFAMLLTLSSCTQETYTLGDLTSPANVVVTATVAGKDATHPNGDGSGNVTFKVTGDNVLGYTINYDTTNSDKFVSMPSTNTVTYKYTTIGVNTYRVTVVAAGKGGTKSNQTLDVTVNFVYDVDPVIVTNLTNNTSKTWVVDGSVSGHFGLGPYSGSVTPEWYSATPNSKDACFYSASFTFAKVAATGAFTLTVASPDGIFTKTGALAGGLPGIPATGDEGCYPYAGGTSSFSFLPASSGIAATVPSTQVAIQLAGVNTFIGYGATAKQYEILTISSKAIYLRVRGTETDFAWYLRLIPKA